MPRSPLGFGQRVSELVLAAALVFVQTLAAQEAPPGGPTLDARVDAAHSPAGPRRREVAQYVRTPGTIELNVFREGPPISPFLAGLASLAIPGLGQALMGQKRWAAYASTELVGWFIQVDRLREGQRARTTYRDLAWVVARGRPGSRENGNWGYYRALASWSRSGAYDSDLERDGLQPEAHRNTFNGDLWQKAREIYLLIPEARGDPTAQGRALSYYEHFAVRPDFYWDWTGNEDDRARYRRLFRESNEAFRAARFMLTGVLANHLFSMADAFVSSELARGVPVRASAAWCWFPAGVAFQWTFELRHR